jgi:hypothetical protein
MNAQRKENRQKTGGNGRTRTKDGRFAPGTKPGPGRPKGRRNKTALLDAAARVEEMTARELDQIVEGVINAAKAGDTQAAKLLLDRVAPARKGQAVEFHLPEIRNASDLDQAYAAVLQAVSNGDLSPEEAQSVVDLLEARRKAMETLELERRLEQLEEAAGGEA